MISLLFAENELFRRKIVYRFTLYSCRNTSSWLTFLSLNFLISSVRMCLALSFSMHLHEKSIGKSSFPQWFSTVVKKKSILISLIIVFDINVLTTNFLHTQLASIRSSEYGVVSFCIFKQTTKSASKMNVFLLRTDYR